MNGEIYNHKELRTKYCANKKFWTDSDCEPIAHLYEDMGAECVKLLDGDFAFALADRKKGTFLAARDPIGVNPLYYGFGVNGTMWFSSELKCLKDHCPKFYTFPPGHYYTPETGLVRYYNPNWMSPSFVPQGEANLAMVRELFTDAVRKRMMGDVPYGVLLSGGLDSSLVASVVSRFAPGRIEEGGKTPAWFSTLHTFSIGLKGAPDLPWAAKVAKFLGTIHHEFHFTLQQGLDAIRDVIWHLETFDCTTIRASTPMYLLSRKIRAMGIKMVLSGEGSDEALAGYLYFHLAADDKAMQKEIVDRVNNLHLSDCLRANKSTMAWGLEARVPFLDEKFLDAVMNIDPKHKMHRHGQKDAEGKPFIEKYILRKAFDTPERPYLPDDCLWRQKEQFSDGVGYAWIDTLKARAETMVTDLELKNASHRFPHLPPTTKEAYWYRVMFEEMFPQRSAEETVSAWVPTWGQSKDPSGRAQKVHEATTQKE